MASEIHPCRRAACILAYAEQELRSGWRRRRGRHRVRRRPAGHPALACLLDARSYEYGLHARVISRFIEGEFPFERTRRWERTLWGYSDHRFERQLVKLRSATTVLVTVAPTTLIVMLDAVLLDRTSGERVGSGRGCRIQPCLHQHCCHRGAHGLARHERGPGYVPRYKRPSSSRESVTSPRTPQYRTTPVRLIAADRRRREARASASILRK